jgi:CheY-like chemotaxis protein
MTASPTICVVDDDEDIREILLDILCFEGYEVVLAKDGLEALERLRAMERRCCLILLDLMMPGMNGWEFRREQLEDPALEAIPVLLLTGAGGATHTTVDLNAAGTLEKPVELDRLLEAISRHCRAGT